MTTLTPLRTLNHIAMSRMGDAESDAALRKRFKELEAIKRRRGLECCAISAAEHKAIAAHLEEKDAPV